MKLILGCGYLGRRVADAWLAAGDSVAALTRSPERAREFEAAGITPILGDVTDAASLAQLPDVELVLWAVGLDRSSGRSQHEVYVTGLRNALDRLQHTAKRLIHISSTSVYGQTSGEWVDESSPCEPARSNGQVGVEAEQLVRGADSPGGLRTNILRLSGIYGPNRLLRRVSSLRANEPLTGNPDAWLNLIHVDDAVRAVLACEARSTPGSTYLVSDDRPIVRREYYERLAELAGAPPPRFAELAPDSPERQDLNKRCSNRRLREELGVELGFPTIETGLADALQRTSTP